MIWCVNDNKLSWHAQIDHVYKSVSSRLALLRRISPYIDVGTRILHYNGYIRPVLDYCSVVWGTCNNGDLQKLLRLQKAAARIILNAGSFESSQELFVILNWQPLDIQIRIRRLIMMYKSLNGMAPNYLTNYSNIPTTFTIMGYDQLLRIIYIHKVERLSIMSVDFPTLPLRSGIIYQ